MRRKTHEEFLQQLAESNPHFNDIEIMDKYQSTHEKIKCCCKICNYEFYITPHSLLYGVGCVKCTRRIMSQKQKKTHSKFVEEIQYINPNIEILSEYQGSHIKLKYRCKKCGNISEQTPTVLLQGHGCRLCANKIISNCRTLNTEEVNRRFDKIKDYVKIIGDYKGTNKKIKCECVICGYQWNTVPNALWVSNCKCPQCNFSHGEIKIKNYLKNRNIAYEGQKKFDDLRGVNNGYLSYDFYLPDYNMLIEYQGEQHSNPIKYFGIKKFEQQKEHDKRKKEYAEVHGYIFLEIWYYDYKNIEKILNEKLFSKKDKTKGIV